jgi:putative ABC transport system permease protein
LLDAVRLRTLPVKEPQTLAMVHLADRTGWRGSQASPYAALTNPIWERFRDNQNAFAGVLAWANNDFNLAAGGEVRLARGLFVNGDFFRILGVQPIKGRVFTAADDRKGCGLPGAVVSYMFWQRELGGDAAAIGRKLTLNGQSVEIVGVTPAGFSGLEIGRSYDVAVPICSQAVLWSEGNWLNEGTTWWLTVMGRLKPGWNKIAGIDVYKKMLAVMVCDVEIESEYTFERRKLSSTPEQLRSLAAWLLDFGRQSASWSS